MMQVGGDEWYRGVANESLNVGEKEREIEKGREMESCMESRARESTEEGSDSSCSNHYNS